MPRYRYKAKEGPGRTVEREITAESRAAAISRIESQGLIPVWVRAEGEKRHGARRLPIRRVRRNDVTVFTRQLASMIRAGVPVLRALHSIQEQTESVAMQAVVREISASIRDGAMLSESLRPFPTLFPVLFVSMVEAGEAGGVLDVILDRLADAREKEEENRRRVQAALAYPLLVAVVGVATVIVLLTFFMPRVLALFDNVEDLPLPTRLLLGTSSFLTEHGYWMLLVVGLLAGVVHRVATLDSGRLFLDAFLLRTPLLGRFLRDVEIGRLARTFALLVDAGIPMDRVLRLSANTVHNAVLQREIETLRGKTVQQGQRLSTGFRTSRVFPPFVGNMIAVGEETGHLEEALSEVARYYEASVERQGRMATALLEPILLLVVGSLVGFIVFAMLMPIFEMGGRIV